MLKQMKLGTSRTTQLGSDRARSRTLNPWILSVYFYASKVSRVLLLRSVSLSPEMRKMSPDRLPWGGAGTSGEGQGIRRLSEQEKPTEEAMQKETAC